MPSRKKDFRGENSEKELLSRRSNVSSADGSRVKNLIEMQKQAE